MNNSSSHSSPSGFSGPQSQASQGPPSSSMYLEGGGTSSGSVYSMAGPHHQQQHLHRAEADSLTSNPLQSLQKLVMLPESQVIDPKSVVNDACLPSAGDTNSKNGVPSKNGEAPPSIKSEPERSEQHCTDGKHCGSDTEGVPINQVDIKAEQAAESSAESKSVDERSPKGAGNQGSNDKKLESLQSKSPKARGAKAKHPEETEPKETSGQSAEVADEPEPKRRRRANSPARSPGRRIEARDKAKPESKSPVKANTKIDIKAKNCNNNTMVKVNVKGVDIKLTNVPVVKMEHLRDDVRLGRSNLKSESVQVKRQSAEELQTAKATPPVMNGLSSSNDHHPQTKEVTSPESKLRKKRKQSVKSSETPSADLKVKKSEASVTSVKSVEEKAEVVEDNGSGERVKSETLKEVKAIESEKTSGQTPANKVVLKTVDGTKNESKCCEKPAESKNPIRHVVRPFPKPLNKDKKSQKPKADKKSEKQLDSNVKLPSDTNKAETGISSKNSETQPKKKAVPVTGESEGSEKERLEKDCQETTPKNSAKSLQVRDTDKVDKVLADKIISGVRKELQFKSEPKSAEASEPKLLKSQLANSVDSKASDVPVLEPKPIALNKSTDTSVKNSDLKDAAKDEAEDIEKTVKSSVEGSTVAAIDTRVSSPSNEDVKTKDISHPTAGQAVEHKNCETSTPSDCLLPNPAKGRPETNQENSNPESDLKKTAQRLDGKTDQKISKEKPTNDLLNLKKQNAVTIMSAKENVEIKPVKVYSDEPDEKRHVHTNGPVVGNKGIHSKPNLKPSPPSKKDREISTAKPLSKEIAPVLNTKPEIKDTKEKVVESNEKMPETNVRTRENNRDSGTSDSCSQETVALKKVLPKRTQEVKLKSAQPTVEDDTVVVKSCPESKPQVRAGPNKEGVVKPLTKDVVHSTCSVKLDAIDLKVKAKPSGTTDMSNTKSVVQQSERPVSLVPADVKALREVSDTNAQGISQDCRAKLDSVLGQPAGKPDGGSDPVSLGIDRSANVAATLGLNSKVKTRGKGSKLEMIASSLKSGVKFAIAEIRSSTKVAPLGAPGSHVTSGAHAEAQPITKDWKSIDLTKSSSETTSSECITLLKMEDELKIKTVISVINPDTSKRQCNHNPLSVSKSSVKVEATSMPVQYVSEPAVDPKGKENTDKGRDIAQPLKLGTKVKVDTTDSVKNERKCDSLHLPVNGRDTAQPTLGDTAVNIRGTPRDVNYSSTNNCSKDNKLLLEAAPPLCPKLSQMNLCTSFDEVEKPELSRCDEESGLDGLGMGKGMRKRRQTHMPNFVDMPIEVESNDSDDEDYVLPAKRNKKFRRPDEEPFVCPPPVKTELIRPPLRTGKGKGGRSRGSRGALSTPSTLVVKGASPPLNPTQSPPHSNPEAPPAVVKQDTPVKVEASEEVCVKEESGFDTPTCITPSEPEEVSPDLGTSDPQEVPSSSPVEDFTPGSTPPGKKKRGRPFGSKNKVPVKRRKRRKGQGEGIIDYKVEEESLKAMLKKGGEACQLGGKKKKGEKGAQVLLGPFIRLTGPKETPTSLEVVNTPDYLENEKVSKKKKTGASGEAPKEKAPVVTATSFVLSDSVPWLCTFCGKGSNHQTLGDLFGPYYPENYIPTQPSPSKTKPSSTTLDPQPSTSTHQTPHTDTPSSEKRHRRRRLSSSIEETPSGRRQRKPRDSPSGVSLLASPRRDSISDDLPPEIWVHEECAVWSHGVYIVGSKVHGLAETVAHAKQTVSVLPDTFISHY